jgi:hypothetical protein
MRRRGVHALVLAALIIVGLAGALVLAPQGAEPLADAAGLVEVVDLVHGDVEPDDDATARELVARIAPRPTRVATGGLAEPARAPGAPPPLPPPRS